MQPFFRFIFILGFSVLFTACQKELPDHPYAVFSTGLPGDVEAFSQNGADWIYACGGVPNDGWVIRSNDRGTTWQVVSRGFLNSLNCIWFVDELTGYAVDSDVLIFKTTDGGFTWTQFYPDAWPLSVNRNLRSLCFVNDSVGFACGGKNFGNGLIYKTSDGGEHWDFQEFEHELRSIRFLDINTGFAIGYGVVLVTENLSLIHI